VRHPLKGWAGEETTLTDADSIQQSSVEASRALATSSGRCSRRRSTPRSLGLLMTVSTRYARPFFNTA
jgi:hypothetical protein